MTDNEPREGVLVGNLGEPIKLKNVNLCGVSASAAQGGQTVKVWTRHAFTSDDPIFHNIAENLSSSILHFSQQSGASPRIDRSNMVLLVIRPDKTGELWVDTAAVTMKMLAKRPLKAGRAVFESDIADVTEMTFPCVEIGSEDGVMCLFREGWRFALFFNFNPDRNLDLEAVNRSLGTLYRRLKYRKIYDVVSDSAVFVRLVDSGWFPFVEILGREFGELANHCEAGFDMAGAEEKLISAFNSERLDRMLSRWVAKPHIADKEPILQSAVRAFEANDPVATIKIVLTEIEGILNGHYRLSHGRGAKLHKLLRHIISSAERKAGSRDSLLFPRDFARYLTNYTFAEFNPVEATGNAGSRHAVGHGSADAESYTQARALQALLTLDQIAFYS